MPLYCSSAATHCKGCVFNRRKQLEDALCLGQDLANYPTPTNWHWESCMWSIQSSYCLDAAYLHQNQTYTTTPTHHPLSICAVPIDGEKMLCNQSAHFESLLLHVIRRHCRTPSRGLAQKYPLDYGQVLQVQGRQNQKFASQMSCELAKG